MIYVAVQGAGNFDAIKRMLDKLCIESTSSLAGVPDNVIKGVILPGNGSFDQYVKNLRENPTFLQSVMRLVDHGTPLLGICVGMQVLFQSSAEGVEPGLGILNGTIEKLSEKYQIPNLGWHDITHQSIDTSQTFLSGGRFYFSHSFAKFPSNDDNFEEVLMCESHGRFCAGFRKNNIFGAQFHPEKSSVEGFKYLNNFAEFCFK